MRLIGSILVVVTVVLQINIQARNTKPYKGNAILGNGNICLVYSDDQRITNRTNAAGIQHYYYKDYTVDYLKGSSFSLLDKKSNEAFAIKSTSTGLLEFYKTFTKNIYVNAAEIHASVFVHPNDVTALTYNIKKAKSGNIFNAAISFRKEFTGYKKISLQQSTIKKNIVTLRWNNGVILICKIPMEMKASVNDSSISLTAPASSNSTYTVFVVPGTNEKEMTGKLKLTESENFEKTAAAYWNKWIAISLPADKELNAEDKKMAEFYKKTLYAVKSACLHGMIPADMTGQFVTNNMPQLYPRDAMKSARIFLKLGYKEEAKSIISFWCGSIQKKSKGEFFARYDARGVAVDGGSGARFDEPEWDANGYLMQLLQWYFDKYGEWLAGPEFVYELADFVVNKIDDSGLLYEGGIVEWTAYLPTTNMICAAGLQTAAKIALQNNDDKRSTRYTNAAKQISDNLFKTYDLEKNTYCAVRFHGVKDDNKSLTEQVGEKLFLWDGTMQFGALWGYPVHPMLQSTIRFYEENILRPEGGLQYFQATDNGFLSAYGGDLFFFSTAALAQYYALYESKEKALHQIQWMMQNANTYNLMPERIYLNYSDCADASPLSWCNAEFAAAVYTYLF